MQHQQLKYRIKLILDIEAEMNTLDAEYITKQKDIRQRLEKIQSTCKHELTEYFPDASGNNDSWYECALCGKEL